MQSQPAAIILLLLLAAQITCRRWCLTPEQPRYGLVIEKLKFFGDKREGGELQMTVLEVSLMNEPRFGILNTLSEGLSCESRDMFAQLWPQKKSQTNR